MIYSINIKGEHPKFPHLLAKDVKLIGKEFKFTSGFNVITGMNGTGKSTLLDILRMYSFSLHLPYSQPLENGSFLSSHYADFFEGSSLHYGDFISSVEVEMDYNQTVYGCDFKPLLAGTEADSIKNLMQTLNSKHSSTGEHIVRSLANSLVDWKDDHKFSLEKNLITGSENDYYKKLKQSLIDNLKAFHREEETAKIPTLIFDEPDQHLDIFVIDAIVNTLKQISKKAQIIMSVHNPYMIYRLALAGVNFIGINKKPYHAEVIKELELIVKPQENV